MIINKTVDLQEVAKFATYAQQWWDKNGPLKTLHDINPERVAFIESSVKLDGQRLLDLGCGGGILSEALAKRGALVTGLDVESASIATAKSHAEEQGLAIDYICQPVEDYAPDQRFDVITCMEMLEHVPDPRHIIEHAARLLAPGGVLFLSTINRTITAYAGVILAAEYILGLLPKQTHDYTKFIKPSELAALIRENNLMVTSMSGMSYEPLSRQAKLVSSVQVNYLMACSWDV